MKFCKEDEHKWKGEMTFQSLYGEQFPVCQDKCTKCGAVGIPDWENPQNGIIKIKAKPLAQVFNLADYRKKKGEVANG